MGGVVILGPVGVAFREILPSQRCAICRRSEGETSRLAGQPPTWLSGLTTGARSDIRTGRVRRSYERQVGPALRPGRFY